MHVSVVEQNEISSPADVGKVAQISKKVNKWPFIKALCLAEKGYKPVLIAGNLPPS
jgi:hypothetical protein